MMTRLKAIVRRLKTSVLHLGTEVRLWWHAFVRHPVTPYITIIVAMLSIGLYIVHTKQDSTSVQAQQSSLQVQQITALANRLAHDEQIACQIQAIGLPANRDLVVVMQDIHTLLTLPLSPAQKRAQAANPPTAQDVQTLASLNEHLAGFLALTGAQPQSRSCTF